MGYKCSNCDHETETVPGYVTRETLKQQILDTRASMKGEVDRLTEALTTAQEAAARVPGLEAERDAAVAQVTQVTEAAATAEAFREAGIADDETLRSAFHALHASAMAGKDDADRVPFPVWVASEEARGHVLLRNHYADADPTSDAPPATDTPVPTPRRTVDTEAGASSGSPLKGKAPTPADIMALTGAEEFKRLPYARRMSVLGAWESEIKAGTLTEIPTIPNE